MELLKEAIPSLKSSPCSLTPRALRVSRKAHIAARQLGLNVRLVEIRDPAELETALASIAQKRVTAVTLIQGSFLFQRRSQIAGARDKKPAPGAGLEQRLGRKAGEAKCRREEPAAFLEPQSPNHLICPQEED